MRVKEIIDRIKLLFHKDKELYFSLYSITGYFPHRIEYYKRALLHKSMGLRNDNGHVVNNERLEFLGDAVLGACVGDIVFRHFPNKRLSNEMGITKLVHSNGTMQSHNSYMGGNAFEALVGALYLDQGYDACMKFVEKRILAEIINIDKVAYKEVNFKSKLIEWGQKNRIKIEYELLSEERGEKRGEKGSPKFTYRAIIEGIEAGIGVDYSKKESQQKASREALLLLRKDPQFLDSVFAAKAEKTRMEEMPVALVPEV